ncbi:MAG: secretin N-terminal domain-containing protein [Phycisphaeraceae bacterium]
MSWQPLKTTAWLCTMLFAGIAVALAAAPVSGAELDAGDDDASMVALNFPENMDIKVLVDYVGKRLDINFIYDEQILNKKVTIVTPQGVPAGSLMTLLESALKMKGLTVSPTEVPGLMRVEAARALTARSVGPNAADATLLEAGPTTAITRVFTLEHTTPQRAAEVVTPFLSTSNATLTPLSEDNLVIVTDYLDNMPKLEEILALVDRPGEDVGIEFVAVEHLEAEALAQKATELLSAEAQRRGQATSGERAAGVSVTADARTNRVVVVGPASQSEHAIALIASLDISLGLETQIYPFAVASPDHVDDLVKKLIGERTAKRLYNSATDRNANLLIATTTPAIHSQIQSLKEALDKPIEESQYPVRFYKLQNAKAKDVLATLRSIEGSEGLADVSVDGVTAGVGNEDELAIRGPTEQEVNRRAERDIPGIRSDGDEASVTLGEARVMADEPSNMIIVVARPAMQRLYEKLIERLDLRRPQVLIEATVVAVDTTDGFSLGVEISQSEEIEGGDGRVLNFSSFGLSDVDPATGELTLRPGIGFNGALLSADIADVILRALETDQRARVVSRPSVLINDNAMGVLFSEREEPFASVNASDTVATTSLGGYVSAGTRIEVTPQISEGDHLKIVYEITLSDFGDDTADGLPPSRQNNSITSEATIPNGHTIVVGGLTRDNASEAIDRVPILGSIPYLELLFSSRTEDVQKTTLFVFIRAVILRDDKFADLKSLSGDSVRDAEISGEFPDSEPVVIP